MWLYSAINFTSQSHQFQLYIYRIFKFLQNDSNVNIALIVISLLCV